MDTLAANWPVMALPVVVTILGGVVAVVTTISPTVRSSVQHFTAGVVFAALAGEVIPDVMERHAPAATITGFVIGVALMYGLSILTERLAPEEEAGAEGAPAAQGSGRFPGGLVAAVAIDGLVDGMIIGIGFTVGASLGLLVALALSLEMFFLGLSTSASLRHSGTRRGLTIGVVVGVGLMIAVGATLGVTLLGGLSSAAVGGLLAFGAAALLYLVTEELLIEAHTVPETRLMSSLFFAGFLLLLVVEMVL